MPAVPDEPVGTRRRNTDTDADVATELSGNVRGSEVRRWRRACSRHADRTGRYDQATYNRILEAVGTPRSRGCAPNWQHRRDHGRATRPREEAEAARIARAIPRTCFRQQNHDQQRNDRDIIAEAAILGFTVLATENLASIRHHETNAWLQEEGLSNRPLLVRVDEALAGLAPEQRRRKRPWRQYWAQPCRIPPVGSRKNTPRCVVSSRTSKPVTQSGAACGRPTGSRPPRTFPN